MLNRLRVFSLFNILPRSLPRVWVRRLIVPIALLGAAGMGPVVILLSRRFSTTQAVALMAVLAILPLGVAALQFILNRRYLIPLTILATAAFTPIALPTGTGSMLVDSLLVTVLFAALWVLYMLLTRRNELVPSPFNLPFFAFAGLTLWSIGWSTAFRDVLVWVPRTFIIVQSASGVVNIMLPGAALLVNNFIHEVRWLKWLTAIMLFAGIVGLIPRYTSYDPPFINENGLFNMWVMTLAGALALFARTLGGWGRLFVLILALAYAVWGLTHISWLAGWLPGLFALAVLLLLRFPKLTVVLGLITVLILAYTQREYIAEAFATENSISGETRLAAWLVNWGITKDHLLFGTGPAGYAAYYMSYFPDNGMATHSNYIDILSQNGIFGFIAVLTMLFQLAYTGFQVRERIRGRGDFVEALANAAFVGTLACILAMGFGDWLFPFAYTQTITGFDYEVYSWLFMGTVFVLERLTRSTTNQESSAIICS